MEARKLIESLKAELTCSICLGYFTDPVTALKCGHNFCKDCLLQCNEQADATLTCPECRAVIRYSDIVPNENLQNLSITGKTLRQHLLQSPALLTTCDQHGKKEKLFCEQDQKLICDSCLLTEEHKDHQVLPLQMAVDKCKKKLQETRNMLQEKEEEYKKAMDELIELDETLKRDSDYFQQLIRSEYKKMHEFLCNEEEINMEELTQEITDNQERFAKMEYSKHVQHFQRILEIKESLDEAPLEILQDMKAILEWNEKVLHQETQQFDFIWESHQMTGLIEILRSYQMNISLDPEIDSLHLIVPEYLKYKRDPQDQSDKEEKLDYFVTVLGIETFSSGKHYWEVDVEGQTEWVLGICEESVSKNKNVSILSKDVRVMIGSKVNDGILFWSPQCCFVSIPTPKVGVFLNYEEGEVSFYDIEDKSNLFSFPNSAFQGPVRPFFSTSLAIKEVALNHPLPTPATVRRHMRR